METRKGIIISLAMKKGFGFIRQEDGTDIYFHEAGVIDTDFTDLREGMEAEYMVVDDPGRKKPKAIGVVVI